jgi:YidC/Oxa1 family membrane protein insertase
MIPFSLKQAKSAAMMQQLAPEMQKIRDKYKEDMEGQSKALRELYAKHNFNPFGGCLLVFFQLPIFVGLYRCLSVDIDLRDAPLIPGIDWASNLAGPDKLFYWKDFLWSALSDETGWLGPYFNVFPIITMVLFIIQQKMFTPPATDEQTKMQQTMMTYMTIWMGFLFYKVPAGLCIYFITSSLWGICERKLLPKPKAADADSGGGKELVEKRPPRKPSDNGGGRRSGKKTRK